MYATNQAVEGIHGPEWPIANELLRCDVYGRPDEDWDEEDFRISAAYVCCPACARVADTVDQIRHEDGCPLAEARAPRRGEPRRQDEDARERPA
jgi:hypothetical protein